MFEFLLSQLRAHFGLEKSVPKRTGKAGTAPSRRRLGLESLESRELLSVTPASMPTATLNYSQVDWFEQLAMETREEEPAESGLVSNEWLVQVSESFLPVLSSVSAAADYLQDFGVSVLRGLGSVGTLLVRMESDLAESQSETLAGLDCFDFWEQNYATVSNAAADLFNDPLVSLQWALDAVNVSSAWNTTKGSGVVVAVLDTGIQLNHPDLQANIWTNTAEIAGNGIDDDGNGFIDDRNGWNAGSGNGNVTDTHSHGTHVSGIVAAVGNNGTGLVGVAPESTILPVKMGDGSFTSDAVIAAINYVVKLKTTQDVNIKVMNGSFGGDHDGHIYRAAVQAAADADILFVVSAGNSSRDVDVSPHSPSGLNDMENVISIASTDKSNNLSDFSNYGVEKVDLAAPGSSIYSTLLSSQYGTKSGTSMAAPMVSGAAALVAAANPDWSAAEIKAALMNTATTLTSLVGKTKTAGLLNIGAAIVGISGLPTAPSGLSSDVQADGSIRISWQDNSNNEIFFELQSSTDGGGTWTTISAKIATSSKVYDYVPAVVAATQFRLRAVNSEGASGWSNVSTVSKESLEIPPPSPLMKLGTGLDDSKAFHLSWQDRSRNEDSFQVQRSVDGGATWTTVQTLAADTTGAYVPVIEGTANHFRVRAVNEYGESAWGQTVIWDATVLPAAPRHLRVIMSNEYSANLRWEYERGENLIAVCVEYSRDGGVTWVTGVYRYDEWDGWIGGSGFAYIGPAQTWLFRIRNWNTNGYSEYSETISVRYVDTPTMGAPTNLSYTIDPQGTVLLYWNDVATVETGYEVQYSTDGGSSWQTLRMLGKNVATTYFSNPQQWVNYSFRVRAIEGSGYSAWSNIVTFQTNHSERVYSPGDLAATSLSDDRVQLSWRDWNNNETGFEIQYSNDGGILWWTVHITEADATSATLYVNPDLDYMFRIRALNERINSYWDRMTTVYRWSAPVPITLSAPTNVRATQANTKDAQIQWNAVTGATGYRVESSLYSDRGWITLYEGTATSYLDTSTLEGMTYYYRVVAVSGGSESAPSTIVSIKTGTAALPTPTGVTAVQANSKDAKISWSAVSGAASYRVVRSLTGTGSWQEVYSGSQTSFTDTSTVENTTYYYRVYARSSTKESAASATVSIKTGQIPLDTPEKVFARLLGVKDVEVSWYSVAKATSYRVERSANGGLAWSTVYVGEERYYIDSDTAESTEYQYRVFSLNSTSVSPGSEVVAVTTGFDPATEAPNTPTGLKLSHISLWWVDMGVDWNAVDGATSYVVERSLNGIDGWLEAFSGTRNWFYDKNLEWGTQYYYRVAAVNKIGQSEFSAAQSKTTVIEPGPLMAIAQSGGGVYLNWGSNYGERSYLVERSTDGVTWKKLKTVKNVDSYYDTSTAGLTTYQYRVTEITSFSQTVWTREATTVAAQVKIPTLKLVTGNSVSVTWANVKGNAGYEVQRSTDGWNWEAVPGVVAASSSTKYTFVDYGLAANTTYYYQVRALGYDEYTVGNASPIKSIVTAPSWPENFTVQNITDNSASLSWQAVEGATSYKIEYLKNGKWASAGTVKTTEKVVKSLKAAMDYEFRVVAVNKAGRSISSEIAAFATLVKSPAAPKLKTVDNNSVSVVWTAVKDAIGYILERSVDGVNWEIVTSEPTVVKTKYTVIDIGLEANTPYFYRLTATGATEDTNSTATMTKKTVTTAPATPPNVIVQKVEYNLVTISWDAVAGATGYKVEKFAGGKWTSAGTTKTASITLKSLKPDTEYTWRITAVGRAGRSAPCAPFSVTTLIAPPTVPSGLKVATVNSTSLSVKWNAVTGAEYYLVERYDPLMGTWTTVTETAATTLTDTGLTADFSYGYRVTAINSTGTSKATSKVTGKTAKS